MRYPGARIAACRSALALLAALAIGTSVSAQVNAPIPGLAGTYVEAELTGWVMLPSAGSQSAVRLVIAGSQVPGGVLNSCLSTWYPCGTEVHLVLSQAGVFECCTVTRIYLPRREI